MNSTIVMNDFNGMRAGAKVSLNPERGELAKEGTATFTVTVTVTLNAPKEAAAHTNCNPVEAHYKQPTAASAQLTRGLQPSFSPPNIATKLLPPKKFAYYWSHQPEFGDKKCDLRAFDARWTIVWQHVNGHLNFDPRKLESYADFRHAMTEEFYLNDESRDMTLGDLVQLRVAGSKPRARRTFMTINADSWEDRIVPMLKELPESRLCIVFGARKNKHRTSDITCVMLDDSDSD